MSAIENAFKKRSLHLLQYKITYNMNLNKETSICIWEKIIHNKKNEPTYRSILSISIENDNEKYSSF